MLRKVLRRAAIVLVVVFPIVILWLMPPPSAFSDEIIPKTPAATARWIDSTTYSTCSSAMIGTPVADQQVAISESQAASIGVGVLQSQTDIYTRNGSQINLIGPSLVQRQFPDGKSRTAWLFGAGKITDKIGMDGFAAFVYIDAQTGEPLLLVPGLYAGDPSFTCSQIMYRPLDFSQVIGWYNLVAITTMLYLIAAAVIAVVVWGRRRAASRL